MINLKSISKNLKSFSYETSLLNADFLVSTNWTPTNSALSVANNTLSITGNGTGVSPRVRQITEIPYAINKYVYFSGKFRVTNNNCTKIEAFMLDGSSVQSVGSIYTINSPTQDAWYSFGFVGYGTNASGSGNINVWIRSTYADAATSNGKVLELKDPMAIDITTLFGAGSEPSAADCANIFKFVSDRKTPSFSNVLAT